MKTDTINDLFGDNCDLNATSEMDMQNSIDKFSAACDNFSLTISAKKTRGLRVRVRVRVNSF